MNEDVMKAIDKAELNILANIGTTNAQSGVTKEFDLGKKRDFVKEMLLRHIKDVNDRTSNYRKRNPKKLTSIFNKRKKDVTLRLSLVLFKDKVPSIKYSNIAKPK